jgi:hypothetical protein
MEFFISLLLPMWIYLVYWERGAYNWDLAHAGFLFVNGSLALLNASAWNEKKCKLSDKFQEQDRLLNSWKQRISRLWQKQPVFECYHFHVRTPVEAIRPALLSKNFPLPKTITQAITLPP